MRIAPILLAAGAARRFGADKRMARMPSGETLLEASLNSYLQVFEHCLIVVDRSDNALQAHLQTLGVTVVVVDGVRGGRTVVGTEVGMGDSLAAGA